jgi:thiaminase (transcriptional activator TenA)
MTDRFSARLWADIDGIYQLILAHPFLTGLTDGTLPDSSFRQYAIQDALYLQDYARSLAMASAKSPKDAWCEMFADHAKEVLVGERSLHEAFFGEWGMSEADVYTTPQTPTTLAYTSYLLRVAHAEPFEDVVGTVLPCYWIYWEVGKALSVTGSRNPTYQKWIDTYATDAFAETVQSVIDTLDESIAELSPARRKRVRQHFITTSRFEWMFWDAAYRLESWPV